MPKSGGFTPVRHLHGLNCFQTQRFQKNTAGDAGLTSLIYAGDVVTVTADGTIKAFTNVSASRAVLGVAARVLINEAGRPRVHGLPDQHPNISLTAQADYIDVYTDPAIVYECFVDTSAAQSMIGQGFNVLATARVTAAGRSGHLLGTAAEVSAKAPFKVIGVSDFSLATRAGDAEGRVNAIVNYGILKSLDSF